GTGELGTDGGAAVPAQRASTGAEEGTRARAAAMIGNGGKVGDALAEHDGFRSDGLSNARSQILRREITGARALEALELGLALGMPPGVEVASLGDRRCSQPHRFQTVAQLPQGRGS